MALKIEKSAFFIIDFVIIFTAKINLNQNGMKKTLLLTVLCAFIVSIGFSQSDRFWSANSENPKNMQTDKAVARQTFPKTFKLFNLNIARLRDELNLVTDNRVRHTTVITLPNVAGELEEFEVVEASNFVPELQARFPEIRAFSGRGKTDKAATVKLSISPQGIQTMVFRHGRENEFMEPYSQDHNVYAVYVSQRDKGSLPWTCSTQDQQIFSGINAQIANTGRPLSNTGELKTMRLAQSCNGEYSNYFGAFNSTQVALVLAAYNATLTRCNGIYEEDLALHLNLIANTDLVIYYNPGTDPYTTLPNWNNQLQTTLNTIIGAANYDIGHMFGASGGGGNAGCIGCVCGTLKGSGITSPADGIPQGDNFDIDYVAHEVGHQLGANHTFSMGNEGTGVNKEVGSGITIMGYAGITAQDVAPHSIDIFHEASIQQIQVNLATKACPITTNITAVNATPVVAPVANYTIPISTPFALTGSATDANPNDVLTYCWEQDDNSTTTGNASVASPGKLTGPNWLSFNSTTNPVRTCPILPTILAGNFITPTLPGGDPIANIEALSSVGRNLKFRLTVRDNSPYSSTAPVKVGQTAFTDMTVTVTNTSGPFGVSQPNTAVSWQALTTQTVTWTVANTTNAPVSCSNVNILLSTDGGFTFPVTLVANTANDGTEDVIIPNSPTTTARIKVESVGNIFFDICNTNFTILTPPTGFTFDSPAAANITCAGAPSAAITLGTAAQGGFSTPINLTSAGNPAGTTVSFAPNPLTPGGSTVVTLNNTNTLAPGNYDITITGTAGTSVQTRILSFIVAPGTPPSITAQPTDVAVCAGVNAIFSVTSSSGPVTYQWQVSTDGGLTYNNIAGAVASTYTVTPTLAENGYRYKVIVSAQCGSTTSNAALLSVNASPAISTQPSSATVCAGSSNTFSVTGTGGGLTYQWQESTNGGVTFTNIGGATSATYVLSGITIAQNNNQYQVIINGSCPGTATSTAAILTVGNAPNITAQPTDVVACNGTSVSFSATASGSNLSYQWQVSTDGGLTYTNIAGATNATFAVTANNSLNGYLYKVIITSASCATPSTSNAALLTVNALPAITAQPSSATLCAGSNVTFTSAATGTGISYQWQLSTNGGVSFSPIAGATNPTYTILGTTASQFGYQYQVVVNGVCAPAATSSIATLNVISPVIVTTQPAAAAVCDGSNTTLSVAGSGTGVLYQWQVSTNGGTSYSNIAGATNATLNLNAVTTSANGNLYRVLLSNSTCTSPTTSNTALLTVNALPNVTSVASETNVCTGTPVTLTASGATTYSWVPTGLTGSTIVVNPTVNPATPSLPNTITYVVTGTDGNGCVNTDNINVTANPLPVVTLTANPNIALLPGRTVTLRASVTPSTGFTFVWRKNGVIIPNTSDSLVVTVQDVGAYTVEAADANGFCNRTSAELLVRDSITPTVFLWPNPNNGNFTVSYYNYIRNGNQIKENNITIFDSRGARVYSKTYNVNQGYNLMEVRLKGRIANGTYFVVLRDGYGNKIASAGFVVHQ